MNKRLFVALDPPALSKVELAGLCTGLPDVRWTVPEQLHLTLCFIGEIGGSAFLDIREALEEIAAPPFDLKLQGLGLFPPRRTPRVLWVGVAPNPALIALQRKVSACVRHCGIKMEKRKFTPHITLGRLQDGAMPRLERYLGAHALFSSASFAVEHFTLYSSVLGRSGATHLAEAEYALLATLQR
ncbi:MAG: RNA 2',3'-cyclic phosphodiesterase [Desulfobulbaceae bacterium]|nr:RNA 2',3'-cyclic phosphodiesterase [Desulfobulbaceae bacterium]